MPVSQSFLDMLRELLAPVGGITVRKMFGGASLYADGVLFALVDDDALYLKGDEATAARFEAEGCKRFTYEGKMRPVSMSYWRAPERLFDEPDEMVEWAREALGVARAASMAKARGGAGTSRKRRV
ncbi:MAG: TfoX/Sxy family protein [Hyphomicrobium sp.]